MMPVGSPGISHRQLGAFGVLALGAAGLTWILSRSRGALFQPYFGKIDPLLAIALVIVVGAASLVSLQRLGRFEVFAGRASSRGLAIAAGLATLFAAVAIAADFALRFPEAMNVLPPDSLLFYPTIGFVAEVAFHLLPLAILLAILRRRSGNAAAGRAVWFCILVAAVLEPTFQAAADEQPISWAGAFVWVHVFAFNLAQLWLFRSYDFVSMFTLRLVYYLYWHVVWGVVRLQVLF